MSKPLTRIVIGVAAALCLCAAAATGLVAYNVLQTPATAGGPIQAIPLSGQSTPGAAGAPLQIPGGTLFEIKQSGSQAKFQINEVLRGSPFTATGTTNQIAGQIAVDPKNPSAARIGTIQIAARTFKTDDNLRDRAIQNAILETGRYEFITFAPTALRGLPSSGKVGDTYTFQIDGNLTIHGVTRAQTFEATITSVSSIQLKGSASATVRYADYKIGIPQVPFVSGVSDTVKIQMDFEAAAV